MKRILRLGLFAAILGVIQAQSLLVPSTIKGRAPDIFRARFTTTKGDIVIEVNRAWAPIGADRFYNLVRAGFFTDASFFRVVPGFMAQFGLSARPDVSRAWYDAKIVDDPVTHSNSRGTLVFATAGANTRTTQFFINYGNNARLDPMGFSPFGEVIEGMDTVVDKLFSGYGESPDQGAIQQLGKAYLDRTFPRLDRIISAVIVPAEIPTTSSSSPLSSGPTAVPRASPELVIQAGNGKQIAVSNLLGKVSVLEFMFTNCPHCQSNAQVLNRLYQQFGSRGFQPIAVTFDGGDALRVPDFVRQFGISFPVGYSSREEVMSYLGISTTQKFVVPQIVVIDRNGVIRAESDPLGAATLLQTESFLREFVKSLLDDGPTSNWQGGPNSVAGARQGNTGGGWLDVRVANWNRAGAAIPIAPRGTGEPPSRCAAMLAKPQSAQELALSRAGWSLLGTARLGSVSVTTGLLGFDGMCRAYEYQMFVFVSGQFAGTLSPTLMYPRNDGSAIKTSFDAKQAPVEEFARYSLRDPLCCASGVSTAEYEILLENGHPVVGLKNVTTRAVQK